jgi:D-amino-acid dehydrogenase
MKAIIVGAGIFGASTAYHLVRRGVNVTIVDGALPGQATAAGAGIVSPWVREIQDRAYYEFATAAAKYYQRLTADLRADGQTETGYRKVGSIALPAQADELEAVHQRLLDRQRESPEIEAVRRIGPDEIASLFPPIRRDLPGIHIEGSARVDGRLMASAMIAASIKHGARFRTGSVSKISFSSGRVFGLVCNDEVLEADVTVIAAGAWTNPLVKPLGFTLAIEPQRGQIMHLRYAGSKTGTFPIIQPLNGYYMLAFDDARIVVGATREFNVGLDHKATAKGLSEVLGFALEYAPGVADSEVLETRVGFRPMAFDNKPMFGPIEGITGLFIANGLGHSGLSIGPYAGAILAKLCLGDRVGFDLEPFDPLRKPSNSYRG